VPEDEEKLEHSCEEILMESYVARSDLIDHPLDNPDLVLYTNGSLFVRDRLRHARFVVVSYFGTIQPGSLPPTLALSLQN
jgi:hypothetical protein